jgi:hypothetical protein
MIVCQLHSGEAETEPNRQQRQSVRRLIDYALEASLADGKAGRQSPEHHENTKQRANPDGI